MLRVLYILLTNIYLGRGVLSGGGQLGQAGTAERVVAGQQLGLTSSVGLQTHTARLLTLQL